MIIYLVVWFAALSLVARASSSDNNSTVEQKVKAASLYKFLGYVEWPPAAFTQPDSPFVIGVDNADQVADELSMISSGRTTNNRTLTIRRLKPGDSLEGIHVLFIGQGEYARQAQLLKLVQSLPVLTITETDDALTQGSMINFCLVDNRVRFDVSLDAIEKSYLHVSSRMLSVARIVRRGTLQ